MKKRIAVFSVLVFLCVMVLATSVLPGTVALLVDQPASLLNIFVPDVGIVGDDISVSIIAEKTVYNVGSKTIGPEGFQFILENNDNGSEQKILSNHDGIAEFILFFTKNDIGKTYNYTLYERNDGRKGVTFSHLVYDVEISIENNPVDGLHAIVTINDEDTNVASFLNIYKEDGGVVAPPDTGDHANLILYAAMIITGIMGVIVLLPKRRNN